MNALKVGTPASMSAGSSPDRVGLLPAEDGAQPEVDDRLGPPCAPGTRRRPRSGEARAVLADAGARVVEGQDRRRPAARPRRACRDGTGAGASSVAGAGGCGRRSTPGRTSRPVGVDDLGTIGCQAGTDALDAAVGDRDVGRDAPAGVTTVPPRIDDVGPRQALGDLDLLGALPQHAAAHLGQPLLPGDDVAKWLPASGPTRELKLQAPYGKRISHSLMSPV